MGTAFLVIPISNAASRSDETKLGGDSANLRWSNSAQSPPVAQPRLTPGRSILFRNFKPKGVRDLQSLCMGRAFGQQIAG